MKKAKIMVVALLAAISIVLGGGNAAAQCRVTNPADCNTTEASRVVGPQDNCALDHAPTLADCRASFTSTPAPATPPTAPAPTNAANVPLTPGQSANVTCGPAQAVRPTRVVQNETTHASCRHFAEIGESGSCQCVAIPGYIMLGPHVTGSRIEHGRLNVRHHTERRSVNVVEFDCTPVPNGYQVPTNDQLERRAAEDEQVIAVNGDALRQQGREIRTEHRRAERAEQTLRVDGRENVRSLAAENHFDVVLGANARYQFGEYGSGAVSVGGGIVHYPHSSSVGVRFAGMFAPFAFQSLVPGLTPLFAANASVDAIFGRGDVQGHVGVGGGGAWRFGSAGRGEVSGGTSWFLGLRAGLRLLIPLGDSPSPARPRFLFQPVVTLDMAQAVQRSMSVREPFGAALGGELDIGFNF